MMASSIQAWMPLHACPVDPLALPHPQANHVQSQGCRGGVSKERQLLIGDGPTEWMTEEVDFSSYLSNPSSPPSTTNTSFPPSPLQSVVHVPSDLEVMTSLLQEELAQLEEYFLPEQVPEKGPRLWKCDSSQLPATPQPFAQLPYTLYPTSNQSEASPLLVTMATRELDLLSVCAGPIGQAKMTRPAPYNCSHPRVCGRKSVSARYENSFLSAKGNSLGNSTVSYGCREDEHSVGKNYCAGGAVEVRRCSALPKDENICSLIQNVIGLGAAKAVGGGFSVAGSHTKDDLLMYNMRGVDAVGSNEVLSGTKASVEGTRAASVCWKSENSGGCFLPTTPQTEACHSILGNINQKVKAESLGTRQHELHHRFVNDRGSESVFSDRESADSEMSGHRQACKLKEDHCQDDYQMDAMQSEGGERKQKKRDQNKTAAHRYRQRKRAELDSLEDQLQTLEGRNRDLRDKAESVEREIQYVKDLLIEIYKARSHRLKQSATV